MWLSFWLFQPFFVATWILTFPYYIHDIVCIQDGEVRDQLKNYPVPWQENLIQPSSISSCVALPQTGAAGGYSDLFPERAIREVVSLLRNSLWCKLTTDVAWF